MFPSPEDSRAHKSSASRLNNEKIKLSRRANEIAHPDELASLILEISGKKYRQGNRIISFVVEVPIANFKPWATKIKIASQDMDQFDRQIIRKELTKTVRKTIKPQLAPSVFMTLDSGISGDQRFSFKVKINVLKRP